MKMQLMAGAALLALFAATPALADPDGVYVAGDIGHHFLRKTSGKPARGSSALRSTSGLVKAGPALAAWAIV